jgi:predicted ATP-grasp superfamily ATP-dependent carboligase
MNARPPVLVLGGGVTALGTLRCLGRRGVEAYVHGSGETWLRWSRWYREPPASPGDQAPTGLAALLSGLADRVPGPVVLMPCSDPWLVEAVSLPASASGRFPACVPPPDAVAALVDKGKLTVLLRNHGIPQPLTLVVRDPGETDDAAAAMPGRMFLKPRDSHAFQLRFGVKGFRFADREEASRRVLEVSMAGLEVVVQEYVPGPPTCHYFIDGFADREGRIRALFARQRRRMYPPDFGNSTALVSVGLSEVRQAVEDLRRLLDVLRYRGIFSAEFKRDPRDGVFKLLEVNPRPWWYVEFAERAGVNVCEMAYRDALGLDVLDSPPYRIGARCVYPYYDRLACADLRRRGQLSLWTWARSWLGVHRPIFSWSDPLPAAFDLASSFGRWLAKRLPGRSPARAA